MGGEKKNHTVAPGVYARAEAIREAIHAQPELSGQEAETSKRLQRVLRDEGFSVATIPNNLGFLAILPGGKNYSVGYRAELDALPLHEATGLPYASRREGVMHACGHDMHMGIAVGLGLALRGIAVESRPTLVLAFESSEELLPGGAEAILASAAWKENTPQYMLGLHCEPTMDVGEVGIKPGYYMASGDEVYITIHGKGGHAALPHQVVDPVLAAAHTLVALQSVTSRHAPPLVPTVLSFGHVECGGAMNLIPDSVRLDGTLRTHNEAWREEAKGHIRRIAEQTAAAMGARADVEILTGYPTLYNHPVLAREGSRLLASAEGVQRVHELDYRLTCDDFSRFSLALPSLYFRLGVGQTAGLHSSAFCPSPQAIRVGINALLNLVMRLDPVESE